MLGYDADDKVMMMSAAKDNRDGDDEDDSMTFSRCNVHWNLNLKYVCRRTSWGSGQSCSLGPLGGWVWGDPWNEFGQRVALPLKW